MVEDKFVSQRCNVDEINFLSFRPLKPGGITSVNSGKHTERMLSESSSKLGSTSDGCDYGESHMSDIEKSDNNVMSQTVPLGPPPKKSVRGTDVHTVSDYSSLQDTLTTSPAKATSHELRHVFYII